MRSARSSPSVRCHARCLAVFWAALSVLSGTLHGQETILQYFNTSWREIEDRLPEVAEAGYTALWLPQPAKGCSGTYSVGYDVFDRFDLGDKNQMGTVRTRYGTKAELLSLVEKAHRLGLRVHFDNVMAHNAGPLDDVPANPRFVHEVLEGVYRLCPFWLEVAESLKRDQVFLQAGQYTVTPDDKPIIGPHPQIGGLFFNTGYSGHGIMGAPGGGRLLADLVSDRAGDHANPFSFQRLAGLDPQDTHRRLL